MTERRSIKKFFLGTSVKITAVISVDTATTAVITILDASLTKRIDEVNMTKQVDKVYSYIYQSNSSDVEGCYTSRMEIEVDGYNNVFEDYFELVRQTGT